MRTQANFKGALQMMLIISILAPAAALAQDADQPKAASQIQTDKAQSPQKQTEVAEKKTEKDGTPTAEQGGGALGMSIRGNHEAPKALVLVPWKPSEPGKGPEISTKVDDSKTPIDKEVFTRMLNYYEIRSESERAVAAPAQTNTTTPVTATTLSMSGCECKPARSVSAVARNAKQ
jgi:hypothetical protein